MGKKKRAETEPLVPESPPLPSPSATVRERVVAHVAKAVKRMPEALRNELILTAPQGPSLLDSMGIWDLMTALEAEFGVSGKLTDLNKIKPLRLADVVALVEKVVSGG